MKIEPVTKDVINMLARTMGPVSAMVCNLGEADISRGCGVVGPAEKCLWTKDGRRISIELVSGGGFIAACSKEPDPEAP